MLGSDSKTELVMLHACYCIMIFLKGPRLTKSPQLPILQKASYGSVIVSMKNPLASNSRSDSGREPGSSIPGVPIKVSYSRAEGPRFLPAITQRGFEDPQVIIFRADPTVYPVSFLRWTQRSVSRREGERSSAAGMASVGVVGIRYLMQKTGKGRRPMEPGREGMVNGGEGPKGKDTTVGHGTLSSGDLKIQLVPR